MTNPLLHAIVFIAAVVIPGGLLVYFAWAACERRRTKLASLKANPNQNSEYGAYRDIPAKPPTPHEARDAFTRMYPPESLRVRARRERLDRVRMARTRSRKKSQ